MTTDTLRTSSIDPRMHRSGRRRALSTILAATLVASLLTLAAPAGAQESASPDAVVAPDALQPLGLRAAESYRQAARYPEHSRVLEPGAADPVRAKRTPSPHSLRAGEDGPVITVWSRQVSFEHPAPVDLYATLEGGAGRYGRTVAADITGEVVSAGGEVIGTVSYRDDGKEPDRKAGDGIHSARFAFPADRVPALAESFGVRVSAVTAAGERAGVMGGFLYADPHARLTGRFRDSVRDGSLVVEAQVKVSQAGRFHLAATLASQKGEPLGWAQTAVHLEEGYHWLELSFYGLMFRERNAAGPYRLASVALSTTTSMPNALNDLLEDVHLTKPYRPTRFTGRAYGNPGLLQAAERLEAAAGEGKTRN